MKVFIVTKEPFPHGMAAVRRIVCYAKAWMSQGIKCEILIYTRTEVYGKIPKNKAGKGVYEGIPFMYMKNTPFRESNVMVRRLNDYMDRYRLKRYLIKNLSVGDVVYAYNGGDDYSLSILKTVHSLGASYMQELCELPFGTSEETPKRIKKRKAFEQKFMSRLDGMIAISDALVEYARQHCSPNAHIVKIPILVDFPKYEMADESEKAFIPYIFHSGTLYQQKDGFLSMLKAFAKASKQLPFDVHFVSTGNPKGTRHEAEINEIINTHNINDKIIFTGYLTNKELRTYLSKAAFVVINKLTTKQNIYCFSTKLGEYMAASKAVIVTNVGEAMNWLNHEKDAFIIEPNNVDLLANAMIRMFCEEDFRKTIGVNACKTCKGSFSIEANAARLKSAIENVALTRCHNF